MSQPKYSLNRRDYNNIRHWYEVALKNSYDNQPNKTTNKQIHFRIQIKNIKLLENYVNMNLQLLSRTLPNGVNMFCCLYCEEKKQYSGRPYDKKGILCLWKFEHYQIKIEEQIILYCYMVENRSFMIELQLVDNNGLINRLGGVNIRISQNKNNTEIPIINSSKNKVGELQCNIQLIPVNNLHQYLPPQVIINSNTMVPPLGSIQLKKKKHQFTIPTSIDFIIKGISLKFDNYEQFLHQIQIRNPYRNYNIDEIKYKITKYQFKLGYHNGWMIINQQSDDYMKLIIKDDKLIPQKQTLTTQTYETSDGQLLFIVRCQVIYTLNQSLKSPTANQIFIIGWIPIIANLGDQQSHVESYLVNDQPIPPYKYPRLPSFIKLTLTINNPSFKKYKKKVMEQIEKQTQQYNHLISNPTQSIGSIMLTTNKSASMSIKSIPNDNQQIQSQIIKMIQKLPKNIHKKIVPKGISIIKPPNNQQLTVLDYKMYESKVIHLYFRIKSILPHTNSHQYYIPSRITGNIYILQHIIKFNTQLSTTNINYGIPVHLNGHKGQTIKIDIINEQQLEKLAKSYINIQLDNTQLGVFYAQGRHISQKLLRVQESSQLMINLLSLQKQYYGSMIIQYKTQLKEHKSHKQVEPITSTSIAKSLPMKQRLQLRIHNYTNTNEKSVNEANAIHFYKQKVHMNFIHNVLDKQYNNDGQINYQVGKPQYIVLHFTNQNSSENNIFQISLDIDYAQLVIDLKQYNKVLNMKKISGKLHKIKYIPQEKAIQSKAYYQTKILYQQTIQLIVKYTLIDWYPSQTNPSNLKIYIDRNTMTAKIFKIKLNFIHPNIHNIYIYHQIIPIFDNKVLELPLPAQLQEFYKNITPFSKTLKYIQKEFMIELNVDTSKKCIEVALGVSKDQQYNYDIILLKIMMYKGNMVKVNIGQIVEYSLPMIWKVNNTLVRIATSSSIATPITQLAITQQWYPPSINLCCLSPTIAHNIIISLIDVASDQIVQQTIIKLICKLKQQPTYIKVENVIGFKSFITYQNSSSINTIIRFVVSNDCIVMKENSIRIAAYNSKKLGFQVQQNLKGNIYIIAYNEENIVKAVYQLSELKIQRIKIDIQKIIK